MPPPIGSINKCYLVQNNHRLVKEVIKELHKSDTLVSASITDYHSSQNK